MSAVEKKIIIEQIFCPAHPDFSGLAVRTTSGNSYRITDGKCCGRWETSRAYLVLGSEVIREVESAMEIANDPR